MLPVIEIAADETKPKTTITQPEAQIAEPDQEEAQLTAEVETLWAEHQRVNGLKKSSSADLRRIRQELGKKLYDAKQALSRPGRAGEWSGWLKHRGISRASADRWIARHLESIGQPNNGISESIPPKDAIEKLLTFLAEKLKRVLPDHVERYQATYRLLDKLGLQVEEADESFVVLQPEVESDEPEYEDFEGDLLEAPRP
jgi:hypothetical protein